MGTAWTELNFEKAVSIPPRTAWTDDNTDALLLLIL